MPEKPLPNEVIHVENNSFSWIPKMQNAMSTLPPETNEKLVLYAEKEPQNGILGFYNCIRREDKTSSIV